MQPSSEKDTPSASNAARSAFSVFAMGLRASLSKSTIVRSATSDRPARSSLDH